MKKLLCVLFGLAVLGMTSVFAAEGKKIEDLKTLFPDSSVSYTFNMNNKSANDVSIFLIKFVGNTKTEVYEYVIPAKTKDVIEFSAQIDNLAGEWWGFGWLEENNLVGNKKIIELGGVPYKITEQRLYDVISNSSNTDNAKNTSYEQIDIFSFMNKYLQNV